MAVLRKVISILGMILLAAGWFMEVTVLFRDSLYSEHDWKCFRLALLCRWSSYIYRNKKFPCVGKDIKIKE